MTMRTAVEWISCATSLTNRSKSQARDTYVLQLDPMRYPEARCITASVREADRQPRSARNAEADPELELTRFDGRVGA